MKRPTLEQRIAALEEKTAQLSKKQNHSKSPINDWRSTVAMFAGDETMKEIIDEGRHIRDADRVRSTESSNQFDY